MELSTTFLLAVIAGIFGLVVGSFLNVVAYRIPSGKSVVRPPSACPSCEARISPRDNIPVLSWIALRGRCRQCGAKISPRYPLVEAGTSALFVATAVVVGESATLPAYLWFGAVTAVLVLTDVDHQRIPNRILYPGTAVGVVLLGIGAAFDQTWGALSRGALGGVAYFGVLFALALIARGGFGFGDVKLAFVLGVFTAFVSWNALGVAVFGAFLIGGLVSIVLLATKRKGRKDAIPFGPSLIVAAWLAIPFGDDLVSWWLG